MINIPKGTKDVLPSESYKWQYTENKLRELARLYNAREIRTPVFEHTELFVRSIGDETDVVSKEMYTFEDKGGRSITLKPEGTAPVARSYIENSLESLSLPLKTYYIIPAFRYERPQAGRLREFHQFGVEVYGATSPYLDLDCISLAYNALVGLGLKNVKLRLNSIGCPECRKEYEAALKAYFLSHIDSLCDTCRDRLSRNPMRILDCKSPVCSEIAAKAPVILDYLCDDCKEHFAGVQKNLDVLNIPYTVNPRIVRGLDYYSKTVFEFVSTSIGSQGTVLGGGRYDTLIENLGGPQVPAVGFGSGIERMLLVLENTGKKIPEEAPLGVYVAGLDDEGRKAAFQLCDALRRMGISAEFDHAARSVKAQFKYAGKVGAKYVVVIGSNELESGEYTVKDMANSASETVKAECAAEYLAQKLR